MSNIPIKVKLLLYVVLTSLAALIASAAWPQHGLVILFTHDLHSNLEEYSIPDGHDNALIVGGYARLSSAIHKERRGREKNTIVVDGGDFSMGTLFHTIRSSHSAELVTMGAMGYDITTFGNHDFEFGPEQLALALLAAKKHSVGKLPAIVAFNTKVYGQSEKLSILRKAYAVYPVTPYKIIRRAGLKIGIFGLMGKDAAADVPQAGPVVFEDHIKDARRAVDILRNKEKVDMVICLSHCGTWADKSISEDEIMARCVPGIDVIISGHTHTVLKHYILIGSTIIVSSGAYGRYLGCLEVSRSRDAAFKVADYRLIEITSALPKDPAISFLVSSFVKEIETNFLARYHYRYGQPLAECAFSLPRAVNSGLGSLVGDAFRYAASSIEGADYREISLVIEPYGQIRVPLAKGIITVNDAFRVMALGLGLDGRPGYPLVSFYLTGKEIKNALEIETTVAPLKEDAHLQVTGARFSYDPKAAPYARIKTVEVEKADGTLEPLDDSRLYRVCSNRYVLLMSEYLKSLPGSRLSFIPKDKNIMELKEWQALAMYFQSFPRCGREYFTASPGQIPPGGKMYKHTQIGWVVITAALIIMGIMPFLLCKGYGPIMVLNACISLFIGILLLVLFSSLTVIVDNELVKVRFGVGLITIKIALKDTISCNPVKNKWWWGWGIHGYPGKSWLLNVSGLDSVELVMKSGMKYYIGTDEPDKLCEAIRKAKT